MKKLIKNLKKLIPFALILFMISCNTDDPGIETDNSEKDKISGFIQKGPYINGSSLMISELDSKLNPTGKVFNTQITDNKGTFELKDIRFESQYVELIANGYSGFPVSRSSHQMPCQRCRVVMFLAECGCHLLYCH